MNYPEKVEALDRIFYLIGKQVISYRGKLDTENLLAMVWQVTHCYIHALFVISNLQ